MFFPLLTLAIHHLSSRPLRTVLTVFGVGIGVSAAMAMSLANEEVFRSFQKSVTHVVGNITVQVSATEGMLNELVVKKIRKHPLVDSVNPVINLSVKVVNPKSDLHLLNIQAVDLLEWLGTDTLAFPSNNLKDLNLDYLISPDVLFLCLLYTSPSPRD